MFVLEWGPGFRVAAEDHETVAELRRLCALRDDALSVLRICAGSVGATPCCVSDAADIWELTVPARRVMCGRADALRAAPAVPECGEVPGGHQSAEERASAPRAPAGALASILPSGEG